MKSGLPTFAARRLDPAERYGLRLTLVAVVIVLIAVPFSFLLFQVLAKGPMVRLDSHVANTLNGEVYRHHGLVRFLELLSWLGRPPILWTVTAVAIISTWRHQVRRLTIFLLATTAGGAVVSTAVKVFVNRPRPTVNHPIITAFGKSFPSGHALSSTVVYGAVLLAFLPMLPGRFRRTAVAGTVVLVLAIGASRLLLGVHFLSDVLAGYILGLAWLIGATAAFDIWRIERGRRPADALDEGVEPEAAKAYD